MRGLPPRKIQVVKTAGNQKVDFGWLRRSEPVSRVWGLDRGKPIDRHYIELFLQKSASHIRGRVLEFGDDEYTRRFGKEVSARDVWNVVEGNPITTIVGDLASADHVPSGIFDCIICTQTLQLVFDLRSVVATLHRILKPGGVLLATVPGISQISRFDMDRWGDYWRFTAASVSGLFGRYFPQSHLELQSHGNVLSAVAFLYGLAAAELSVRDLDRRDSRFGMLLTITARKPAD